MPFNILGIWLRGLMAIAILAGGLFLLDRWYEDSHVVEPVRTVAPPREAQRDDRARAPDATPAETAAVPGRRVFRFDPGWNRQTAFLASGLALLAWAFAGRAI